MPGIQQQGIGMSANFVLSKFDHAEQGVLQDLKDFIAAIIRVYTHRGFEAAQHFNSMTVFDFQKHRKKRLAALQSLLGHAKKGRRLKGY